MDDQQKINSAQEANVIQSAKGSPEQHNEVIGHPKKRPSSTIILSVCIGVILLLGIVIWQYTSMKKDVTTQTMIPKPTAKIGVLLPFSGGASSAGLGALKGVQLAKKELRASNIELLQEDSQCDAKIAAQGAERLIAKGVVAIIGELCSSGSLGALAVANKAHVPMISPSSSSPALSIPNDYFFRVVPPDGQQGNFVSQLMYNKGLRRVAIIHSNEAYGNGLSTVFSENFSRLGGKIVSIEQFESDDITLLTQFNNIKLSNPDAVYLSSNSPPSAAAILQLMHSQGLNIPVYGGDSLFDKILINTPTAQQAAEGFTVVAFSSGTKTFKQAMADAYTSAALTIHAAEAYDAFQAIYLTLEKGATTGDQIKNALVNIDFDGVSTHIKFDKNGEISEKYIYDVYQVKNGDFVLVGQ